ncbi:hypothetical protein DNTS_002855 [Danionella cerebrum]|uniref:Uncharacterized protein n=1 Tax=Danionella cerebrum TaxID=2873325 RepID=A0A553P960_9TELE|nr:hypothetical protein DNTS_002855 [Danionella translucida]
MMSRKMREKGSRFMGESSFLYSWVNNQVSQTWMSRRPSIPLCKTWWCCIDPVDPLFCRIWLKPRPPLPRTRMT